MRPGGHLRHFVCPLTNNAKYSGDGTLSVMDVRGKKSVPVTQSEDQEDELLSIVAIKGFVILHLVKGVLELLL